MLHLDRPLVFIDIESTGINLAVDRIIEISMCKILPDGSEMIKTLRINPGIPIPESASDVHGIYDADVRDAPAFRDVANEIRDFIDNCDIAGYNSNKFDVPLLAEEFLRAGVEFDDERKYVDVLRIFTLMEKRTLEAAYKFFCNKELTDAHSAEGDAKATYEILVAQLERYSDVLKNDVHALHELTKDGEFVDFGRRMIYRDGVEYFNFGKYINQPVEAVYRREPQYFDWIYKNDFPQHTKLKLKMIEFRIRNNKT